MNLYAVKYDYKYLDNDDVNTDSWYIGSENENKLHDIMENNRIAFKSAGIKLLNYSFRHISNTDNGYDITLNKIK